MKTRESLFEFAIIGHLGSLVCVALLWAPAAAQAVGYRLPNQDPEAIGRANAFVATAHNPAAIYYNPAGITQLEGHNVSAGLYLITAGYWFESPAGAEAKADSDIQFVPQFYYVFSPTNFPLSFGLGVYAPYGLSLDWGRNSPHATVAQNGTLLYLCFNPVVAWQIHPRLSLGIGPTINYSTAEFERAIGMIAGDQFRMEGDGMGYGFNAGLLWQIQDRWFFGANYRSQTTIDFEGTSSTTPAPPYPPSTSSSASIVFPQFVTAGISFRPTENWNLEFNLDWTDWGSVDRIVFKDTAFGDQMLPLYYRSSFMYEFGVTRKIGPHYYASVGFFYSENSSPDRNFTPLIPDSDLYLGSFGIGYKSARWDWAAAYQFGYNPGHEVSNNRLSPLVDGTYEVFNQAVNISATLKF